MRPSLVPFVRALRAPFATRLPRLGAVALLSVLVATCHDSTNPCPDSATTLVFTAQPSTVNAGVGFSVTVEARDNAGKAACGFTRNVTLSIANNAGGGTLTGTTTVVAVAGVATFSNISINKVGTAYSLQATSGTLSAATTTAFTIAPGLPAALSMTSQPTTATAGATIAPTVVVTVLDNQGNATGLTGNVAVAITAGTGAVGATLSGTTSVAAPLGIATFSTLSIDKAANGYTLTATATGLASLTTTAFNINSGATAKLSFTTQPTNADAGSVITPAVVVTAQDNQGNTTPSFTGSVAVAIGTNPGSGTLSGTATLNAVAGVATFSALSINKPGTGYTLTAASGSLTLATSAPFTIAVGSLAQFVFTQPPTNATAGVAIAPAVVVTGQDAAGNTVTGFNGNVTMSIGTNPSGGALSGTLTVAAAAGVATFSTLNIDKAGVGYKLTATAGPASSQSAPFTISAGAVTQLAFTVPPGNTTAGVSFAPAVVVTAQDSKGNVTPSFTGAVTVAIGTNPGSGTLSGTATLNAVAGVATFPALNINKSGSGYTLTATSGSLTAATSAPFTIAVGPLAQFVFTQPPTNATAGVAITPAIVVTGQDVAGNTVTGFNGNVTLTISTNPSGGTLFGTATVAASSGIATFPGLSIDKAGVGYKLTATAGAASSQSAAFSISAGLLDHLVFTAQPNNAAATATIAPPVQVTAQDAGNNTVTGFTGNVTLAITAGTGTAGALITGGASVTTAATSGVATFGNLSIDKAGNSYTLTATATGAVAATSGPFNISIGTATRFAFFVPPSAATAGQDITPAVQVAAQDIGGNTVPSFTGNVTVAITSGTGTAGALLSGGASVTVAAISGVATFQGAKALSIDKAGSNYTLTATGALTSATSAPFNITLGSLSQFAFTLQPTNTVGGAAINGAGGVQVTAQDAAGNALTSFTGQVTMSLGTNPVGGTLTGTMAKAAVAGVATFSDLKVDKASTGYQLLATSGTANGLSQAFAITAAPGNHLAFTAQPSNTASGASISSPGGVQVTAQDANGNTDPTFNGNVVVKITAGTGTAGALLSGGATVTVPAVNGIATFPTLSIDSAGTGYRLTATSGSLTLATSTGFDITPGAAAKLVFTAQPTNAVAGVALAPAVKVTAQDATGNTDPTFSGNVVVKITTGTGTAGALLSGAATVSVAAVNGIATLPTLSIDKSGTGYTLSATSTGLTTGSSSPFKISSAPAATLFFSVQPGGGPADKPFTPAVTVTARDVFNNVATGFTGNVVMAIGANPSAGILSGKTSVAVVAKDSGVATFDSLLINKVGIGYTLTASTTGLPVATSAAFNVTPGTASQLIFTTQPISDTARGPINTPPFVVTALDGQGNIATGFTGNVAVGITTGTGASGAILSGTAFVPAVAGVATFSGASPLSIDKAGAGYTLTATSGSLTPDTSAAFNITAGNVTQVGFIVQPGTATAGLPIAPTVKVAGQDASGNTNTGFVGSVTLTLTGRAGAHLLGTATQTAVLGVASFGTINIDSVGTGYTLTATSAGLNQNISTAFNVTAGAATQLAFTTQPSQTTANAPIHPAVQVTARDQFGNNATGFTGNVTVAIGTNPSGGTLAGTKTAAAVAGVASFSTLSINNTGNGYTLTASATGVTPGTSAAFNIVASVATQLFFFVQPSNGTAAGPLSPSIVVQARDASGALATSFAGNVTVAITSGTGNPAATLGGTKVVPAVSGVATFSTLTIDKSGIYKLTATATGPSSATSAFFTINPGPPAQLVFSVQPTSAAPNTAISPQIEVTAVDANNNVATSFADNVTLAILSDPSGSATLTGTATKPANAGVATFDNLKIDKTGSGYTLSASTPTAGVTVGTSAAFDITAAALSHLAFTTQPVTNAAGASIAVQVTVKDAANATVTGFVGSVTVGIVAGTGTSGATLSGTVSVAAVNGVANFSLSINKKGTGYKLSATAPTVSGATSGGFNINAGAAALVVFTNDPGPATAGATIPGLSGPAVQATIEDALGNPISSSTANVTVAISSNPGDGTLGGTATVAAVAGVATFGNLSIDKTGTGYRLQASSTGLSSDISQAFSVNAAAADHLNFTVAPSSAVAGIAIAPAVTVTAFDAFNNVATGFSGGVTVAIVTGKVGATLSGTKTKTASSGVVSFTDLSIDSAGTGYTLSAIAGALSAPTSATFNISAGAASKLVFIVQPVNAAVNTNITPAVKVAAQDALGNLVTSFTGSVVVAKEPGSPAGTLTGTLTRTAVAGVATFDDLKIGTTNNGFRLRTTSTGLTLATSAFFNITP